MEDEIYKYSPLWGEWNVDGYIGKGSYGKVYKIHKETADETVEAAVKFISVPRDQQEIEEAYRDGNAADEESLKNYFSTKADELSKETLLMMKLKGHNNIVHYEDHLKLEKQGEVGWDIIIRMELLTSLDKYLKTHSFTKRDVVLLGIDICLAVQNCHQEGIMHRDVKIENIFIDGDGRFKLGDFGVSRESQGNSTTGTAIGTQSYMAPEMIKHERYNNNIDVYALGMVLYRLLNNRRAPFLPADGVIRSTDNAAALEKRVNGSEAMPPPKHADGKLAEVILKACAHNRKKRYATPTELRRDLIKLRDSVGDEVVLSPRDVSAEDSNTVPDGDTSGTITDVGNAIDGTIKEIREKNIALGNGTIYEEDFNFAEFKPKKKKGVIIGVIAAFIAVMIGIVIYMNIPRSVPVTAINGLPEENSMVVEDTYSLTLEILPKNATSKIKYVSSDPEIAEIDDNGEIIAIKEGIVTITVSADGVVEEMILTITPQKIPVTDIEGVPETSVLTVGSSSRLQPNVLPEDATDKEVTYESSNTGVAVIGPDGVITAVGIGETVITATADGVSKSMKLTVNAAATPKPASSSSSSGGTSSRNNSSSGSRQNNNTNRSSSGSTSSGGTSGNSGASGGSTSSGGTSGSGGSTGSSTSGSGGSSGSRNGGWGVANPDGGFY